MTQILLITTVEELQGMFITAIEAVLPKHLEQFNKQNSEKLYTAKEACAKLGVSFPTFKSYVAEGKIKAINFKGVGRAKYNLSQIK